MQALADNINTFFHQVAADLPSLSDSSAPPPSVSIPDEFVIDRAVVEEKMSRINIHKSPGPDGLQNWILRDFCAQLAGPVCAIFNASIREGFVPGRWKEANVVPVPKAHPPRSIESDLRPISLTSTLGKLLESIVGTWMLEMIDDKLDNRQYGARKGRSTTHALVDMLHHWHSAIDHRESARAVFIDYAKAFDHVDHNILLRKMSALGLPDIIIRWLHSFLSHRRQRIKIGDVFSEWLEMIAGMPQGSYLGPMTFIVLIDNIKAICLTHKYVDDTTLTEILNKMAVSGMQGIIDDVVLQSTESGMNINPRKTKEMLIGSTIIKHPPPHLTVSGALVERVAAFKILGVYVSSDLKWTHHVDMICSKVSSRMHFLKQLKRAGAPIQDLLCFYTTVIRPVMEYACPVWHSSLTLAQSNALEAQQRRALHIIYGDADYLSATIIAGVSSLNVRRAELTCKFYNKNILSNNSCLHYLLPKARDVNIIQRLRRANKIEPLQTRTERYRKSLIPFSLAHFQ